MATSTFRLGIFYMPQIYDVGPTALLLLRRKAGWGFGLPKQSWRLRQGLNPRTWVLKGSTLHLDHRSRFVDGFFLVWSFVLNTPPQTNVTLWPMDCPLLGGWSWLSNFGPETGYADWKHKVVPLHAMNAYSESRGIAPLILNLRTRRRWEVNITARSLCHPHPKITPVPVE
jgi:hypothetical protein